MSTRQLLWVVSTVLISTSAYAAHCPRGQIYRVHLDKCVGVNSKLAIAYVSRPSHVSLRRLVVETPPVSSIPQIQKINDISVPNINPDNWPPYPRWVVDRLNLELGKSQSH